MRVLVLLGVLAAGCVGPTVPRLAPRHDPPRHRDRLVAVHPESGEWVSLRDSGDTGELLRLDVERDAVHPLLSFSEAERATIAVLEERGALVRAVFDGRAGLSLRHSGFEPVQPLTGDEVERLEGRLGFRRHRLVLDDGEREIIIRSLGAQGEPDRVRWLSSPGGERLAIEVSYDGPVQTTSILAFSLATVRAEQLAAEALEHFEAGALDAAARHWHQALDSDAQHADSLYNLACVEALRGDVPAALGFLRRALQLSPHRYRALAKVDRDLRALRGEPEFTRLIGRLRR